MKKFSQAILFIIIAIPSLANGSGSDALAKDYFSAWVASQSPNAKDSDLNTYLSFLTEDVGHQHLPYDPESSRELDNREKMKEGMNFYLGSHTKYKASLTDIFTGHNVLIIKYFTESEGIHPQTGETIKQAYDTVEVLELEKGKVGVIRKYSE